MELGKAAVVAFKDEFIEGTIIAIATNDEQKSIYKIEAAAFSKPIWVPAMQVYQIVGSGGTV